MHSKLRLYSFINVQGFILESLGSRERAAANLKNPEFDVRPDFPTSAPQVKESASHHSEEEVKEVTSEDILGILCVSTRKFVILALFWCLR